MCAAQTVLALHFYIACPAPQLLSSTIRDPQASDTIHNVKGKIQDKDGKAGLRRPRVLWSSMAGEGRRQFSLLSSGLLS